MNNESKEILDRVEKVKQEIFDMEERLNDFRSNAVILGKHKMFINQSGFGKTNNWLQFNSRHRSDEIIFENGFIRVNYIDDHYDLEDYISVDLSWQEFMTPLEVNIENWNKMKEYQDNLEKETKIRQEYEKQIKEKEKEYKRYLKLKEKFENEKGINLIEQ